MRPANIKAQREKEVRRIWKERIKIWDEIRKLPLIELDKPRRHGWYKEIVLTENLERYRSQKAVEEIFEILDTYFWGRTKKECEKKWNCQRSKHFIYRDVPTISKKQFNRLSGKAQRLCTPFQYREKKRLRTRFYVRIPHNGYRIKFTRAYITHVKKHDPNLHSRVAFLENKLIRKNLYKENARHEYGGWRDDWGVSKTKLSRIQSRQKLARYKYSSAQCAMEKADTEFQDEDGY